MEYQMINPIQIAKELHEQRIAILTQQMARLCHDIQSDEVIQAMRENALSQDFAIQRVKELYAESQQQEQEITIEYLQEQVISLRTESSRIKQENFDLRRRMRDNEQIILSEQRRSHELENELTRLSFTKEQTSIQYDDRLRYQTEEVSRFETEKTLEHIKLAESRLRDECADYKRRFEIECERSEDLKLTLERLRDEFDQTKRILRDVEYEKAEMHRRMTEIVEDEKAVKQKLRKSQSEKEQLKQALEQLQTQFTQEEDRIQKALYKYKGRDKKFKKKLIEKNRRVQELEKKILEGQERLQEKHWEYEEAVQQLRREIEGNLSEMHLEAQRQETELSQKHHIEIQSLQQQYQTLLDNRLHDIQKEMEAQLIRSREKEQKLKELLQQKAAEIESGYIKYSKHQELLEQEKQMLMREREQDMEEYIKRNKYLESELKYQTDKASSQYTSITSDYARVNAKNDSLEEELQKSHSYQQGLLAQLQELQSKYKKLSADFAEVQKRLQELSQQHESLQDLYSNSFQNLQELQISDKKQQETIQQLTDSINWHKENNERLTLQNRQLEKEVQLLNNDLLSTQNSLSSNQASKYQLESQINYEKEQLAYSQRCLSEANQLLSDTKRELGQAHEALDQMKQKIQSLYYQMQEKDSSWQNKFTKLKEKLSWHIQGQLNNLRGSLQQILAFAQSQLSNFSYEMAEIAHRYKGKTQEKILKEKESFQYTLGEKVKDLNNEWAARLARLLEGLRRQSLGHIEDYELREVVYACQDILADRNAHSQQLREVKEENERLHHKIRHLNKKLKANEVAFDKLESEVYQEAEKIRTSTLDKQQLEQKLLQMQNYYKNQLKSYKSQQQDEIQQIKNRLGDQNAELRALLNTEQERRKAAEKELRDKSSETQRENYENMQYLRELLNSEQERYIRLSKQKSAELEFMSDKLKSLEAVIRRREEEIEALKLQIRSTQTHF